MAKIKAVEIYIEVVTHTPHGQPVHIVYHGHGVAGGPLARSNRHTTTQDALAARASAKLRAVAGDDYWSDAEIDAELIDHLAENGFAVTIVPNPAAVARESADAERATRRKTLSRRRRSN